MNDPSKQPTDGLVNSIFAGRYRIERKLGAGGMGDVYLAFEVKFSRHVAIKVMGRDYLGADAIDRFAREAKNLARVSHPNVATMYAFDVTEDGLPYLVMEYVEGETLAAIIGRGKVPLVRTLALVRQTALALAAMHRVGIIHRDLKPQNIMVRAFGDGSEFVKVVDFGIAKAYGRATQVITKPDLAAGTPMFMSPEQLRGEDLDGRSDVYSLGLVAQCLINGSEIPAPVLEIGLKSVIERAIEREREDRFESPLEFSIALGSAAAALEQTTGGVSPVVSFDANTQPTVLNAAGITVPLQQSNLPPTLDAGGTQVVRHNAPPATYLSFISRPQLDEVERSLAGANPVTSIVGLGGVGKSSLAREVAQRTVQGSNELRFHAVVWVSDRSQPGSTTLGRVLDQLADVVDHPGLKSMAPDEKRLRARELCQRTRTLIVFDNLETVLDEELIDWLANVPAPSRVLTTSRENIVALGSVQTVVRLQGFPKAATEQFAPQVMAKLGLADTIASPSVLDKLRKATGGNGKAIEVGLGLIYSTGRTGTEVVATMNEGRDPLFTDLFALRWKLLSEEAHRTLFAIMLLPFGATADLLSLIAVGHPGGTSAALDKLGRLCMVDRTVINSPDEDDVVLFSLNPLVQAFVASRVAEEAEVMNELKERSLKNLKDIAATAGFCPHEIHRLKILDRPQLLRNIESTVAWARSELRWSDVIALTRDTRYYYYVRGIWSPEPNPNLLRAEAAREAREEAEELDALLYYCNIAAKQENFTAFEAQYPRLSELIATANISEAQRSQFAHVTALYRLAKGDPEAAIRLWTHNLERETLSAADESANRRWLGVAYFRQNEVAKARRQFADAIAHDRAFGFVRAVVASRLYQVRVDLREYQSKHRVAPDTARALRDRASAELNVIQSDIEALNDQLYKAEWCELAGWLAFFDGRGGDGTELLHLASEWYDRLGLASRRRDVESLAAFHAV